MEAPTLAEAAPEYFKQQQFFDPIDPSSSVLDLVIASLDDALADREDTESYDQGLLRTFARFSDVLSSGVTSLEITNGREGAQTVHIRSVESSAA